MTKRKFWIPAVIIIMLTAGYLVYKFIYEKKNESIVTVSTTYENPVAIKSFENEYDVIVVGGEPEGVAAAVSAARNGAKTLLIESRKELGGLFTYGMLNFLDIPQGEDGKSVSRGIYDEWYELIGGGNAFGIEEAKVAFKYLVDNEPNLTLSTSTKVGESVLEGNQVAEIKVSNEHGDFNIKGKTFIDATQDADFAKMSNAPYFVGGEDIGIKDKKMAVTLMLHLKNIDWGKVKETAKSEKFGKAEVTDTVAWGFSDLHYSYKPVNENTRLRGLNLVKIDDDYYINALQIFGINGLDAASRNKAIEIGKSETNHILDYLRAEFAGFENAEVASYPEELYVRETRHIWAEYQLSMSDVWTNRDHWDSIGLGAYPVDVQAQTPQDYGFVVASPKQYAIPFRSLVPKEIDGLLVVGRSTGFSSLAAGSARVVPTGMVTGEAAGAAGALAIKENVSFREMSQNKELIKSLRTKLDEQGAFVDHFETGYPYKGKWYDESIQVLMNYGLAMAGYQNDLRVDEQATEQSFINLLKGSIERANPELGNELADEITSIYSEIYSNEKTPLEQEEVTRILSELFVGTETDWQGLIDEGVVSEDIAEKVKSQKNELTMKELYAISAEVVRYVTNYNSL